MRIRPFAIGLSGLIVGSAAVYIVTTNFYNDPPLVVPEKMPDDMFASFTQRAVSGDKNASESLRMLITRDCEQKSDVARCMFGFYKSLLLDAENGSGEGMIAVAYSLAGSKYCYDLKRAEFWLWQARASGKRSTKVDGLIQDKSAKNGCL